MDSPEPVLTTSEALSGIFGSISLAAWVFLLLPQLYENYRSQSAAGISLTFLFIWFLGDVTNLIGAIWASLVPTVIWLAAYFCFSDTVLILQCLYYNLVVNKNSEGQIQRRKSSTGTTPGATGDAEEEHIGRDDEPLLSRTASNNSYSSIGLPGSHHRRRKSSAATMSKITETVRANGQDEAVASPGSDSPGRSMASALALSCLKNAGFVLAICAIGTAGWAIAWRIGAWKPAPLPHHDQSLLGDDGAPAGASVLGYVSAAAYLGARVPQIMKNWRDKSCEGLSLLFFLLSLLGNLTYGVGILCHSLERSYVVANLPWLIGSLGTMVEDCTVFIQFHLYGDRSEEQQQASGIAVAP